MGIYLLTILPATLAAMLNPKMTRSTMIAVWILSSIFMWYLIPFGSRDFPNYVTDFNTLAGEPSVVNFVKDPLFSVISFAFSRFYMNAEFFFLMLASISLVIKLAALRKLSNNNSYAILLYMSSYFYLHEFTQIRVALAIGIWMHALYVLDSSPKRYYFLTVLATMIHFQAAVGLLIPGLISLYSSPKGRKVLVSTLVLITLLGTFRIFDVFGDYLLRLIPDPRTEIYFALRETSNWERPNAFNVINLTAFYSSSFCLLKKQIRATADPTLVRDYTISICILTGSAFLILFSSVTIAAFRLSEFFFCLLPIHLCNVVKFKLPRTNLLFALTVSIALLYLFLFRAPIVINPGDIS